MAGTGWKWWWQPPSTSRFPTWSEKIGAGPRANCPLESFFVIDDGKTRTVADVLFTKGESESQALAETLETVFRDLSRMANPYIKPTKGQLLALLEKHGDIRDSVKFCLAHARLKITDRGVVMGFHWLYRQIDQERADATARKYIVGLGFSGDHDPFYVLRETISKDYMQDRHPAMHWKRRMGLFVQSWNRQTEGREITYLRPPKMDRPIAALMGFPNTLYLN